MSRQYLDQIQGRPAWSPAAQRPSRGVPALSGGKRGPEPITLSPVLDRGSRSRRAVVGALLAMSASGCDRAVATASTYDDCVLNAIKADMGLPALAAVKLACKQKYPRTYDFDSLAGKQAGPTWSEVIARPQYAELSDEEAVVAKDVYFSRFVQPALHPDFVEDAREQFKTFVRRTAQHAAQPAPQAGSMTGAQSIHRNTREPVGYEQAAEHFGAALAAAEAIRVLGTDHRCSYMFSKPPASYSDQLGKFLADAPPKLKMELQAFADEDAAVVQHLRRTTVELVEETLRDKRERMKMDPRTACGAASGVLVSASKAATDQWLRFARLAK